MTMSAADLILNPDGSIYHLGLQPGQLAPVILTVGDPDRVQQVARHFDRIEFEYQKREIKSLTGFYKGKRLSVVSTGMGTDNIDIVLNEIDALFNVDFKTRQPKSSTTQLTFIRLGTSGAIQPDLPLGSILASKYAVGVDALGAFYQYSAEQLPLNQAIARYFQQNFQNVMPYVVAASQPLFEKFKRISTEEGITITHPGFYGPQGRQARIPIAYPNWIAQLQNFDFEANRFTNFDMETAGIYLLASLMGHHALSFNALLANRVTGQFTDKPNLVVDQMIALVLEGCLSI